MKIFKRILYLLYYIKETPRGRFLEFLDFSSEQSGKSKVVIVIDLVFSSIKYNVSILDYFYFRFYNLNSTERLKWAGTGFLYEFQLRMNPVESRSVLENKIKFLNHYKKFVRRKFISLDQAILDKKETDQLLQNGSGKLVLKNSLGQVGAEVEIIKCSDFDYDHLVMKMKENNYDLIEEYVIQHPSIMELSRTGLNTVRIFTQLNNGKVDILGARLRISVDSMVDNMAAGNIASPVNIETGEINGAGVYSDIRKSEVSMHPKTGKKIVGFRIPHWKQTMEMVEEAALFNQSNKSIGWDIAITEAGPELIEGNHNWCKLLWQLPVKKGLKDILNNY